MKHTKIAALAAVSLLALLTMAGCGGGGASNGGSSSPYQGSYKGSIQSGVDNGQTTFNIDGHGQLTGNVKFSKVANQIDVSGAIDPTGNLTASYTVSSYKYTVSGKLGVSPIYSNEYTAILAVHNDTSNTDGPNAALTVTRS
jgi:hypothetical protein